MLFSIFNIIPYESCHCIIDKFVNISLIFRLLIGAEEAEDADRFRVFIGEMASISEATAQLQYRVRALEDSRLVDRCEVLEEKETEPHHHQGCQCSISRTW